ncbi:MAG: dual specificity protein phosphatase [bacterium]
MIDTIKIETLQPPLGSLRTLYMLEPFSVILKVSTQLSPHSIIAEIWTNVIDKFSPEGSWHGIPMHLNSSSEPNILDFHGIFLPTDQGQFEYTVRTRFKKNNEDPPSPSNFKQEQMTRNEEPRTKNQDLFNWQWAGNFGQNGIIKVSPPSPEMPWTNGPQFAKLAPRVYVGNFIAASKSKDLGFQAVLNMAEELNLVFPDDDIEYKKIGVTDGAHNPILPAKIAEAVRWIKKEVKKGYNVCINCRAGIGRSGSIGIAYLYASHPRWSYNQVLEVAWDKKPDIYPHLQLEETLKLLFPRKR